MIINPIILPVIDNELISALGSIDGLLGKWLAFVLVSESRSRLYIKAMNFPITEKDLVEIRTPPLGVLSRVDKTEVLPAGTCLRIYKVRVFDNEKESDDWIDAQTDPALINEIVRPWFAMGYGFSSQPNHSIDPLDKSRCAPTLSEMDTRTPRDPSGRPYSYGKWHK